MKLSHLIDLIKELTPGQKYRYVRGSEECTFVSIEDSPEYRVNTLTPQGTPHSVSLSYLKTISERIAPKRLFNISQLTNNSGTNRPVFEALMAHTSEFYWVKQGNAKMVVWIPGKPHKSGELTEWTETSILSAPITDHRIVTNTSPINNGMQIIYYGSPGTGKSFKVKKYLKDRNVPEDYIFRTTFHPDFDYASFVGSYKPVSNKGSWTNTKLTKEDIINLFFDSKDEDKYPKSIKARYWYEALYHTEDIRRLGLTPEIIADELDKLGFDKTRYTHELSCLFKIYDWLKESSLIGTNAITYKFVPQAFTEAYVKAKKCTEQVYLVIEEINRGNCAQIFGDLFQLLDRKNGVSEYPIKGEADLIKYLNEKCGIPGDTLSLPANLNIIATMNTSDQSLFPMDSAFKRRWDWKYIPTTPPKDEDKTFELKVIEVGDFEYSWKEFLEAANARIYAATRSEDKQLGYWFVKTGDDNKISISDFVSKVVFYLWNDVFKDLGPKDCNPFTIEVDGKKSIMPFNSFFELDSENNITENIGVLHTFLKNFNLTPDVAKEIQEAQDASNLEGPQA